MSPRLRKFVLTAHINCSVGWLGIAGSAAYGNDCPLYGRVGFVRKSDRASGLTRKPKPPTGT